MSEKFYEKFIQLISFMLILIASFLATIIFFVTYLTSNNFLCYSYYLSLMIFTIIFGINCISKYRYLKENLNLFIPQNSSNNNEKLEPLELKTEINDNTPLKTCSLYRSGYGYPTIQKRLGFNHSEQARRELRKGLDFLLKFYDEHNNGVGNEVQKRT